MSLVEIALRKLQAAGVAGKKPTLSAEPGIDVHAEGAARAQGEARMARQAGAAPARPRAARSIRIDVAELRIAGILPPETQDRQLADQFRMIKRPLLKLASDPAAADDGSHASRRGVMVGSALPGDGKTFTAINLALSLARERDHSVLLVDADVVKRDVSRLCGLSGERGLLDALVDPTMDVESAIFPTDIPGLSLLPAGRLSETATELFASARMREVMQDLIMLDPRGIVVVDSPPICLTSDAPVLASLFGQILLVVRAGVTPQHAVLEAIRIIGTSAKVSLVLNQADAVGPSGYHYGYDQGYGPAQGPTSVPRPTAIDSKSGQ
jgi:protein-tyrosine kinase